jgi:hypothetical protein
VCCRKACHKAKRRVGERFPVSGIVIRLYTAPYPAHKVSFIAGGIVLAAICWAPSAQGRFHPEEALYLPTFSHLLIVNKLLSLSGSLSGSLSLSLSLSTGSSALKCAKQVVPSGKRPPSLYPRTFLRRLLHLVLSCCLLLELIESGGRRRVYACWWGQVGGGKKWCRV